jgi:hypothetical protein
MTDQGSDRPGTQLASLCPQSGAHWPAFPNMGLQRGHIAGQGTAIFISPVIPQFDHYLARLTSLTVKVFILLPGYRLSIMTYREVNYM